MARRLMIICMMNYSEVVLSESLRLSAPAAPTTADAQRRDQKAEPLRMRHLVASHLTGARACAHPNASVGESVAKSPAEGVPAPRRGLWPAHTSLGLALQFLFAFRAHTLDDWSLDSLGHGVLGRRFRVWHPHHLNLISFKRNLNLLKRPFISISMSVRMNVLGFKLHLITLL